MTVPRTTRRLPTAPGPESSSSSIVRELIGAEVLVIDKDEAVRTGMTELLGAAELNVTAVDDPNQAWDLLERGSYSVVVIDLDTPVPNAGLDTIATVRVAAPTSAIVVLTPRKSYDDAVSAIRAGAVDVILKAPDSVAYLKDRVHDAATRSLEKRQVSAILREVRETYEELLKRFMDAERRSLDLEDKVSGRESRMKAQAEIDILVVARHPKLAEMMRAKAGAGYRIQAAQTGGEALDRCSSARFHVVMIADDIDDLPPTMVIRSLKAQSGDSMVLTLSRSPEGVVVHMVEGERKALLAEKIASPEDLVSRLDTLTEAFRLRERERRYLQAFRERHYDFLRRYAALKSRIDKVLG